MSENGKEADKGPANPISALMEAAISLHELYSSLKEAGFTEAQALNLVGQSLRPLPPNNA